MRVWWWCPIGECCWRRPDDDYETWDLLCAHLEKEHGLDEADAQAECRKIEHEHAIGERLAEAGNIFGPMTLDTFPANDPNGAAALATVREYLSWVKEGARQSLYIYGPPGVGKSGLAWSIVEQCPDAIRWVNTRALLADAKAQLTRGGHVIPHPLLVADPNVDIVVLDDLGVDKPTAFLADLTGRLVEALYLRGTGFITTSNFSPPQLATRLDVGEPMAGRRIVSRIVQGATTLKLDRPNLRLGSGEAA